MSKPTLASTGKGHVTNLIFCPALNGFAAADTKGYVTAFDATCQNQQAQALIQKDEESEPRPITSLSHFSKDRCSSAMGNHAYSLSIRQGKQPSIKTEVFEFDTSCDLCVASPAQKWIVAIGDNNRVVFLDPHGEVDQIDVRLNQLKAPHYCTFAQFDASATYLAVHATNNSVYIIDIKSAKVVQTLTNILTPPKTLAPTADLNESTFFSQSSFTNPFPASPSLFALPTGATISLFNAKNWTKAPSTIFSPTPQDHFVAVQFSPNNAILAALNTKNELFFYNVVDNTFPLLARIPLSETTTSQLTYLCFSPSPSSNTQLIAELVAAGRDGVIVGLNTIDEFCPDDKKVSTWSISHHSSQFDIAKFNSNAIQSTPSKSPAKFKESSGDDSEEDQIIVRSTSKPLQNDNNPTTTPKKRKEAPKNDNDGDSLKFDLDDKKPTSATKKQRITDYNDDMTDDDDDDENNKNDDDAEIDDGLTHSERLRKSILSTVVKADTTIDLDGITELIRDELHDHFLGQFRKNYITAQKTALQEAFMPTSTKTHIPNVVSGDQVRLLHASEYGTIVSRIHDGNATFGISLHTAKRVEKLSLQFNELHYSMATMDQFGIALALPAYHSENKQGKASKKLSAPSQLLYQSFDDERNMNFSVELPFLESAECIALSKDIFAVATNKQYLRIYDLSGMELEIISIPGKILTMCAKGSYMAIFYHTNNVPLADAHSIQMQLFHTETMHLLYDNIAAISPLSQLLWSYISPTGILYTCDSLGIVRLFSTARGNSWKVICDLTTKVEEKEYFLWPVYINYINESPEHLDKPWAHHLFVYECYKKREPLPSLSMPNLKSIKITTPFSRLVVQSVGEAEKKIQQSLENTARERLLWDELVSTHGQLIPAPLNRTFDTPWVVLGIRLAQQGQTVRAIHIAKQIRDVEMLRKYIEKINTMTHLHDLESVLKELTKILHLKQAFKKLGLFPYQQPLPHAAMYKSKEIHTMAQQPQHITINPFSSPQVQRTAGATRDFQTLVNERVKAALPNDPSPSTTTSHALAASSTPAAPNPFRKSLQ